MCHGIACRIIFVLGGHTAVASPPHREPTIRDRQILQLRNMFWLVYIIDKEISLRTGQPPILQDEFCDLSLPHDYLGPHYTRAATDAHEIGATTPPSLPGDIRLSILKSRTCRLLYSFDATRKSDVELLRSIRELDEELESWRTSIPSEFAPVLSTKFKHSTWDLEKQGIVGGMRQMMLNLEYHHLRTMIHSASGRCMKPLDGTNQMRVSGLQSSLELSVEASRATLTHLSTATHKLPAEAFWSVETCRVALGVLMG